MVRLQADGSLITDEAFIALYPGTSFSLPLVESEVSAFAADVLTLVDPPVISGGQSCVLSAAQNSNSTWSEVWTIVNPTAVVLTLAEQQANLINAHNRFINSQLSPEGFSVLAIGIATQKPDSLAVETWLKGVWTDYLTRSANLTAGQTVSDDFTNNGTIPFSYAAIALEVGGV